jgi:hypothetical protein
MWKSTMIEIGIDSFAATIPDPATGKTLPAADRMEKLLAEVETADRVGLDVFGIGEHHRKEFLDSAPAVILAAVAARTKRIRHTSAVSVLSAADPVRMFQEFATVDLIAKVGRRSWSGAVLSGKPILCAASLCMTTMRCSRKSSIFS